MPLYTYAFVWVIESSILTNRARCALYKKILDLLDEESISGASIYRTRSPTVNVLKCESIAKVRFKFFFVHKHIYLHMDTSPDHMPPLALCVWGKLAIRITVSCIAHGH